MSSGSARVTFGDGDWPALISLSDDLEEGGAVDPAADALGVLISS